MQGVELTNKWSMQASVEKLLLRFGCYYADKLYRFSQQDGAITLKADDANTVGKLVIIGREHYYESIKDYPIGSRAELKKALQMEQQHQPLKGMRFQHIQRIDAHNHRVTSWVLNQTLFEAFEGQPIWVMPESKLLAEALPEGAYHIARPSGELFLCNSATQAVSGIPTVQVQSLETFCYMAGFPVEKIQPTLSASHLFTHLRDGCMNALPHALVTYLYTAGQRGGMQWPWKKLGAMVGACVIGYFAATSGWLVYQNHRLDSQLSNNATNVEAGLELKRQYREASAQAQFLAMPTAYSFEYWQVWPLLIEAVNSGSKIERVDYQGGALTIYGTSNKASELLSRLSQHPSVSALEIAAPIRKRRGTEHYAFRMNINPVVPKEEGNATR